MKKVYIPRLGFVLFYAAILTFGMWGWHELVTILPEPLGIFTTPDNKWFWETFAIVTVWLFINLCQVNNSLSARALWGILFSASVAMVSLTIKTGWQGLLANLLMKLPLIGEGVKSAMIFTTIPKVVEVDAIVLFMGKISGLIEIELPEGQWLSGSIRYRDDGWRQY